MKKYFLLWISFCTMLFAYGQQAGNLDQNFAGKGWTAFYFGGSGNTNEESAKKVLRQTDGKYILLIQMDFDNYSVLTRYNTNGTIDNSFGTNGFSDPIKLEMASGAALQIVGSDMKIIVVGAAYDANDFSDFGITRFNSDGTLDKTFGTDGRVITDFYGDNDNPRAVAVQEYDNKIVVAGMAVYPAGYGDFALARYNADGSPDTDFGTGGKVTTDFNGDGDMANAVLIQSDNKIVLAGTGFNPGTYSDFGLARYNSDGSLDTDFGSGGKVTTDLNGNLDIAYAIAFQNVGGQTKIVAIGSTWANLYDFGVVRYNSDGTLDTGFDTDGKVTTDVNSSQNEARDVAIQSDNKIIVTGYFSFLATGDDYGLIRYNVDGSLDATGFGSGGVLATDFGSSGESGNAIFLTASNIIVAGGTRDPGNLYAGSFDFSLLSFQYNGSLVTSFGYGGEVKGYYASGLYSVVNAVTLQNVNGENKTVVAGSFDKDFALARFNADGTPDASFGINGKVFTDFYGYDEAKAVAVQTINGVDKIVLAGTTYDWESGNPTIILARYNSDGSLDQSFGTSGKTGVYISEPTMGNGMAIQNDGKILVAGQAFIYDVIGDSLTYDFALVRLNIDGTLDPTFGTNGIVKTDCFGYTDMASSIVIQTGGKIVVAGSAVNLSGNWDFAIARYGSNGAPDASFGLGGKLTTDFDGDQDMATSVVIQPDGKIVVAGNETIVNGSSYNQNFALARYTSKGKPDLTFGTQGKSVTDFGSNDVANTIALQSDGYILVAGSTETSIALTGNLYDIAIARYTAAGVPDPNFGTSGILVSDFGYSVQATASTWKNDRLIVAGTGGSHEGFALLSTQGIIAVYKTTGTSLPSITIDDVTVNEGQTATLTINLSQASSSAITVNYTTQDVTAIGKGKNPDYKFNKGTITIPAGQTTAAINIATYSDNLTQEGSETFNVNLSLNNQMAILAHIEDGTGEVTIQDVVITVNAKTTVQNIVTDKLTVIAFPNPSNDQFTLQLQSKLNAPVRVTILDATGRIIETRNDMGANGSLQLGINYRPGVYYAQIVQGLEKITMKLIKQK